MIELLVGMVIVSLLSGLSISGWSSYQKASEQRGSAQELVSTLRNAQQNSLAEASTYCISFNVGARSYQVFKGTCAAGTAVGSARKTRSNRVHLVSPAFQQADSSVTSTLSFSPRGSATKGTVKMSRDGGSATYTITVEGLTGRVSLNG